MNYSPVPAKINVIYKMEDPSSPRGMLMKVLSWLGYITVEPTMIFYMMAFMITSVVEKAFYVYKACTVNHGYNASICENIHDEHYGDILKKVQITVANFHIWNSIASSGVPIVLALFMGAWSDKRGRKLLLLLGLVGKLYFSVMIVVNTMQETWPVEYVVYTATLPMAITGADVAIFAAAFSYVVDVSSPKNRTIRVTILEVCYLATMPTGIALGSFLFTNVLTKSYTLMFVINISLMVLAVLYTAFRLEWRSNPQQRPLSEASNIFLDFFDFRHVAETAKTFTKKRSRNRRSYLCLLILMMALYVFQRDEREMMYLFCQRVLKWSVSQFSTFRTFQSGIQDVVLLLAIPLMSKVFRWRDTVIVMIGAGAHTLARIFYATADVSTIFYVGGVFASVGPIVAPVIRSLVSKIVSNSEKGKAFSVLAVADNAVPIISGIFYSTIYNWTIDNNPESIFYLTMATQVGVFLIILFIHLKTEPNEFENEDLNRELNQPKESDEEDTTENNRDS